MLVVSLFLAACGSSNEEGTSGDDKNTGNEGTSTSGNNTLVYAMETAFDGLLDVNFYQTATDAEILAFTHEGFIKYDENLKPVPNLAEWTTEDNKTYTFKLKEGVKWHNGDELVVDDWIFALETIATLGTDSARWSNVYTIEGARAFNDGTADSISGLNKISDYEIEITFESAAVNNLENLWTYPLNRNHFSGLEPSEMAASDKVRVEPIGTGPYKVKKVLPGESVELEAFEEYWGGTPHIENIVVKVISGSTIVGELQQGRVDLSAFHPSLKPQLEALDNVRIERFPGLSYYYIGFDFGDLVDGKVVMDENPKYGDVRLRQAMLYALNREEWIGAFFGGLGQPLNSVIPSTHWIAATNDELPINYTYDPAKAEELLDEAGYVDVDGDGFREDPNGEEFVINFAHFATGNQTFETRAQQIVQYWEEVGLQANLTMVDAALYYDKIQKDENDPAVEVFYGGWSVGSDPDPSGLWAEDTLFNYPRWVNDEALQILKDAVDLEVVGQDTDLRRDLYVQFQSIFNEQLPVLPIMELEDAFAVSNRVEGITFDVNGFNNPKDWKIVE